MQMPNNLVPACMLYVAADPMHGLVTPLPFVLRKSHFILSLLLLYYYFGHVRPQITMYITY